VLKSIFVLPLARRNKHKYIASIFFLFLISFTSFFSTYKITESPPFWYDEGINVQAAANIANFGEFALQVAPNILVSPTLLTTGYPVIYPVALSFNLFGTGVLQARLIMALFIIATVATVYLLSRSLFGFYIAASASLLIASFPPLYGNGKSVLGEIPGVLFLLLFLYFVHLIERTNYSKRKYYIFAGLTAGLCVATKPIFILLIPAILAGVLLLRKQIIFNWQMLALGASTFFIPILIWFKTQDALNDSFFLIFGRYVNPSNYSSVEVFNVALGNFLKFFTEISPAYFFALFTVWSISFIVRLILQKKLTLVESFALAYSALVVLAYLRIVGWYRYFFTANIMALLFFPNSLYFLFQCAREKIWRLQKVSSFAVITIVLLLIGMHNYKLWSGSWVARSYTDTKTAEFSEYFGNFKTEEIVFVYDLPEVVMFLPTKDYYQMIELTPLIGGSQMNVIELGIPDVIVVKTRVFNEQRIFFELYTERDRIKNLAILEKR